MSENSTQLHAELARLRDELACLEAGDTNASARIAELIEHIDQRLDATATAQHHASLLDQINKGIEDFETEHPRATGILNQIAMTLTSMGI